MSCGVGHRCSSDPALLWLWRMSQVWLGSGVAVAVAVAVVQASSCNSGNLHVPRVQP